MQRLMFSGGRILTKEELAGDELIAQMLEEAKEEGKAEGLKDAKKIIIQSLTADDVEALPQAVVEKILQTKKDSSSLLRQMAEEKINLRI